MGVPHAVLLGALSWLKTSREPRRRRPLLGFSMLVLAVWVRCRGAVLLCFLFVCLSSFLPQGRAVFKCVAFLMDASGAERGF